MSDENKISILNCFELERPLTVKEISEKLKKPYSKVNYHIKLLEKAGLVEVVETKVKSGIIEKYYLPTAEEFAIDKSITVIENDVNLEEYKEKVKSFYKSIFKSIEDDYKYLIDNLSPGSLVDSSLLSSVIFLDDYQARTLKEEINDFSRELINRFGEKRDGTNAYSIGTYMLLKKNQDQYKKK
nr:winged helix-turn-helix domain-containing protein [Fervidicella metallireducens]